MEVRGAAILEHPFFTATVGVAEANTTDAKVFRDGTGLIDDAFIGASVRVFGAALDVDRIGVRAIECRVRALASNDPVAYVAVILVRVCELH